MTLADYDRMGAKAVAVTMAFDAFRICLGGKPKTWTKEQVLAWINLLS